MTWVPGNYPRKCVGIYSRENNCRWHGIVSPGHAYDLAPFYFVKFCITGTANPIDAHTFIPKFLN